MGRPRKPTSQHELEGTFRKDRHGARADRGATLPPIQKPKDLDGEAGRLWDVIVGALPAGVLSQADMPTLVGACRWWAEWRRWDQALTDDTSEMDPYKAGCLAGMAWKCFMSAASKLGLSPVDRAKLDTGGGKQDPGDELEGFAGKVVG